MGGGLYTQHDSTTVRGMILSNTTPGSGGGIYIMGGNVFLDSGNLIENNTADADDNNSGTGGGICLYQYAPAPTGIPDYGAGNWRGVAAPVLNNCYGTGCP